MIVALEGPAGVEKMMKTRSVILVALLLAGAACSSDPATSRSPAAQPGETGGSGQGPSGTLPTGPTGTVGLQLTIPGGASINAVQWSITGPNNATTAVKSGSVDVHASAGTMFQVSQIPAGTGYHIQLSAASVDGGIDCSGSAAFTVMPQATTTVQVQLVCISAAAGHTAMIGGSSFDCAAWNSVSASPNVIAVGSPISLSATASGPVPGNLTYTWSAPSGSFTAPTSADTNFVCSVPGQVNITLVVGDGAVPEGSTCNPALDTDMVSVTCTGTVVVAPPAPAMPPWGLLALSTGLLGVSCRELLRRRRFSS
jgi:hypothetical protein